MGVANMPDLESCPECGGKEVIMTMQAIYHVVTCYDCNSKSGEYDEEQKAIEAWNQRASE